MLASTVQFSSYAPTTRPHPTERQDKSQEAATRAKQEYPTTPHRTSRHRGRRGPVPSGPNSMHKFLTFHP
jgi:hypothetical protein